MLQQNDIDAVVVNTPDHTHAVISLAAMMLGKHVYCEKPLASSVYEARLMADVAAQTGVVTQMGNTPPVPEHLDWHHWLGPVPERPYHPAYHPGGWRVFWGFGSGNFGDMGCHILDAPYWGLNLRYPIRIEAEGPPPNPHVAPKHKRVYDTATTPSPTH